MRTDLFPTPLWSWKVATHGDISPNVRSWTHEHTDGSGRWQSQTDLHTLEPFAPLCSFILKKAKKALKDFGADTERHGPLAITGMWVNHTTDHRFSHETHTHPNNFLSGIYYAAAPPTMGRTAFVDPRPGASVCMPRPKDHNGLNAMKQVLRPSEGSLIMFPAYLPHLVTSGTADAERITVSFNLTFQDGEMLAKTLWGE